MARFGRTGDLFRAILLFIGRDRLALTYLVLMPLCGITLLLTLPPLQMPDELTHLLKAEAISQGDWVAHRLNAHDAGSLLPEGLVRFAWTANNTVYPPRRPYAFVNLIGDTRARFDGPYVPAGYPNTAIYPPFFYFPSAVALGIARVLGAPVFFAYLCVRLAVLLTASFLGACAIAWATRARLLLALLLSLPMDMGLFVSCAQDGVQIATAALVAVGLGRCTTDRGLIATALLLGLVIAAKPAYLPLAFLPMTCMSAGRHKMRMAVVASCLAMLVPLICTVLFTHPAKVGFRVADHVAAPVQLMYVVRHPLHAAHILASTLRLMGWTYMRQFVGVLGRLQVDLGAVSDGAAVAALLVAALSGIGKTGKGLVSWRNAATGGILAGSILAVFMALYMIWTPVAAPLIEGIQGRYFIPIAIMMTLLFPQSPEGLPVGRTPLRQAVFLGGFMVAGAMTAQRAIMAFYWLPVGR